MECRIIAKTTPLVSDITNTTEFIAYVARVSNPDNEHNRETSERLVKYLQKNQHWSPFEMYNYVIEIKTTRDISRQILRHRSFAFQEFSQRYANVEAIDMPVFREARLQDTKNRQNSLQTDDDDLKQWFHAAQQTVNDTSKNLYKAAVSRGIAKEQARVLLPEGLTPTRLYANGTLRSWIHYVALRSDPGTQKEHRDIAVRIAELIAQDGFPQIMEFVENEC